MYAAISKILFTVVELLFRELFDKLIYLNYKNGHTIVEDITLSMYKNIYL